jgi:hypothetical protein
MIDIGEAVQAIKSGDKAKGRSLLAQVLKNNPQHENAWLWLATVVDNPQQKRDCLQRVLKINPRNQTAREGLRWLEQLEDREAEGQVQLQDIFGQAADLNSRPQSVQIYPSSPSPLPDEELLRDEPGQAGEIVILYLKLTVFMTLPATIFVTLQIMFLWAYIILIIRNESLSRVTEEFPPPFGEIFKLMLSADGLYFGIIVSRWVFLIFAILAMLATIWHVLAVRKLPGGKRASALKVEQEREIRVRLPYDQTFRACQSAIVMHKGWIVSASEANGRIRAQTGVNMRGWGENLYLHLVAADQNSTYVSIISKPRLRTILIDQGRSLQNVETISNYLKLHEQQSIA